MAICTICSVVLFTVTSFSVLANHLGVACDEAGSLTDLHISTVVLASNSNAWAPTREGVVSLATVAEPSSLCRCQPSVAGVSSFGDRISDSQDENKKKSTSDNSHSLLSVVSRVGQFLDFNVPSGLPH